MDVACIPAGRGAGVAVLERFLEGIVSTRAGKRGLCHASYLSGLRASSSRISSSKASLLPLLVLLGSGYPYGISPPCP